MPARSDRPPALSVTSLTYAYDQRSYALRDVSLQVPTGSIVGLIGPNGSGKSTLIRLIFDLLATQHGSIELAGRDSRSREARTAGIYLSSNDYLPQFLTGAEYIRSLAKLYGEPYDAAAVGSMFRRFAMAGREDDLLEDYSHGMRKKTQLISAMLLQREVTVIDETLNGIDVEALHLVERDLEALRCAGRSVLLCTHDFSLLERIADRVLFLDRGRLVTDAPLDAALAQHGTLADLVFGHLDRAR